MTLSIFTNRPWLKEAPKRSSLSILVTTILVFLFTFSTSYAQTDGVIGLEGKEVRTADGESAGEIQDVVVSRTGQEYFVVLSIGGFWGIGEKQVLIPGNRLQLTDQDYLVFQGPMRDLEALPEYEGVRPTQYIRRNFRRELPAQQPAQEAGRQPEVGQNIVSTMVIPTGEGEGSLRLERRGPAMIRAGERYTYTITVTNNSQHSVQDVVVVETNPGNFELVREGTEVQNQPPQQQQPPQRQQQGQQGQQGRQQQQAVQQQQGQQQAQPQQDQQTQQQAQQQDAQQQAGRQRWLIGALRPGESKTIQAAVIPRAAGQYGSCLMLDYKPSLCTEVAVVKPELELMVALVDLEGKPLDLVYPCDEVTAVYRVVNVGTGITEPVVITGQLPEGLVTGDNNRQVSIDVGPLQSGQEVEKSIVLRPENPGVYLLRFAATTGNISTEAKVIQVQVVQPQLTMEVTGPQRAYVGREARYEVALSNVSNIPVIRTALAIQPPQNARNFLISGQGMEIEGGKVLVGQIDPNQTVRVIVTFDVEEPGQAQFDAIAEAYCIEAVRRQVATEFVGIPAVLIELVDKVDPVKVGDVMTYEIQITNQGTAEDLNVQLQGQLPQGLEYVTGEGDTAVQVQGQNIQFGQVKALPPGAVATWLIQARGRQAGTWIMNVQMTSNFMKRTITEQEATVVY